jgi:hypothetical protein
MRADWTGERDFQDVPPDSIYFQYVESMYHAEAISGYNCGGPGEPCVAPNNLPYFRPLAMMTRGHLAKLMVMVRMYDYQTGPIHDDWNANPSGERYFQDVDQNSPYYKFSYQVAARHHIMTPIACGGPNEPCVAPANLPYFRPNGEITRNETAEVIAKDRFGSCLGLTPTPVTTLIPTPTGVAVAGLLLDGNVSAQRGKCPVNLNTYHAPQPQIEVYAYPYNMTPTPHPLVTPIRTQLFSMPANSSLWRGQLEANRQFRLCVKGSLGGRSSYCTKGGLNNNEMNSCIEVFTDVNRYDLDFVMGQTIND